MGETAATEQQKIGLAYWESVGLGNSRGVRKGGKTVGHGSQTRTGELDRRRTDTKTGTQDNVGNHRWSDCVLCGGGIDGRN